MNLLILNSPYCHILKYLLFLLKHPVYRQTGKEGKHIQVTWQKREASIGNLVRGKGYAGKLVNGEACTGQLEREELCVGKTKRFISISKTSRFPDLMLVFAIEYGKGTERVIKLPFTYEANLTANTPCRLQECTESGHKISCTKVRYSVMKAIKLNFCNRLHITSHLVWNMQLSLSPWGSTVEFTD